MHSKKDISSLTKSYFWALIPLLLFSLYKNSIYLYINKIVSLSSLINILYFYVISIVIGFIISKIFKDAQKITIFQSLIIAFSISINTNYIIYPILLFVMFFIVKCLRQKFNFNEISIIRLFLVLSLLLNFYSYHNMGERLGEFNFNNLDIFLGFGVGGLASSSTLILIISFLILSMNKYYKKNIAISGILSYILVIILGMFLLKQNNINLLLNGHNYFNLIFIATDIIVSPYTKKGMIIYGILIGLLTGLNSFFNYYEASYISIFIISLFIPLINRLTCKKYLQMEN